LTIACTAALLTGCGSVRETLPDRSAMEQLIISTAADRAIATLPPQELKGKAVFLDTSNLESYDKPYVVQQTKRMVFENGGRLADDRESAQVVLEIASGGLSINRRNYLFGIPAIPLPVPFAGEPLVFPEIPIFKVIFYKGKAKLLFIAVDPASNSQLYKLPMCYGKSLDSYWWFLFFGPFQHTDLPEEIK